MDKKTFELGDKIRREVMGNERVDGVWKRADSFTRPIHELITEYCWGALWGREALDRRTRSIANIAMLAALNRQNEFKLHVAGAIENGVTPDEIRELCLQVAIYAGVPAGLEATNVANEVLEAKGVKQRATP